LVDQLALLPQLFDQIVVPRVVYDETGWRNSMKILLRMLKGMGALAGAYVFYMFAVAVAPGISAPPQPLKRRAQGTGARDAVPPPSAREVDFTVDGTPVNAWLYLPRDLSRRVPCVVLAHGLGGTKAMGLDGYASRFQDAGLAALAFDYRHFGASGGQPRQLAWIPSQQQDWTAAVAFARSLPEVDPARIGLWGTSLSGGHVLWIAARDPQIACVSAQCPLLDGAGGGVQIVSRVGLAHLLEVQLVHGVRDLVRSWLGLPAHKIALVGRAGTVAAFAEDQVWEVFEQLASDDFVNEVCARIFIRMDKYHPIREARRIACPVLLQVCEQDVHTPPRLVQEAERQLGARAEIIHYPIDHFDIYLGERFERAVADQLAFFQKHLATAGRVAAYS
jgi:uncharacterized protein